MRFPVTPQPLGALRRYRPEPRREASMSILWIILIVVLVLALLGFFGFR
jgi:flagellar basal body-associated protein FliL